MDRTATATIEGFNYQHNKSILEIIRANKTTKVMLEGCIEDIDIIDDNKITAIQCKYYESIKKITPSAIAKPILDMLVNHITKPNVNFKLYIHYEGIEVEEEHKFDLDMLNGILKTRDKNNIKKYFQKIYKFPKEFETVFSKAKLTDNDVEQIIDYIEKNENKIKLFDKKDFINKVCIIRALKNEKLVSEILNIFIKDGFSLEEAEKIIYPNFFQKIAEISSNDDENKRTVSCGKIKEEIYDIKELVYTKWLSKLYDKKKYIAELRKHLRERLQNNCSFRVFIIKMKEYSVEEIALFIKEYLKKYCNKKKLNYQPLFMLEDDQEYNFLELQKKLYFLYKIQFETGDVGRIMSIDKLFNNSKDNVKICMHSSEIDDYLTGIASITPDDLIVLGNANLENYKENFIPITKINNLNIDELLKVFYLGGV